MKRRLRAHTFNPPTLSAQLLKACTFFSFIFKFAGLRQASHLLLLPEYRMRGDCYPFHTAALFSSIGSADAFDAQDTSDLFQLCKTGSEFLL